MINDDFYKTRKSELTNVDLGRRYFVPFSFGNIVFKRYHVLAAFIIIIYGMIEL